MGDGDTQFLPHLPQRDLGSKNLERPGLAPPIRIPRDRAQEFPTCIEYYLDVDANVSGTCTGVDASVAGAGGAIDSRTVEGRNGCSASFDLAQLVPAGLTGRATVSLNLSVLGADGASFGAGKGGVVSTIRLVD